MEAIRDRLKNLETGDVLLSSIPSDKQPQFEEVFKFKKDSFRELLHQKGTWHPDLKARVQGMENFTGISWLPEVDGAGLSIFGKQQSYRFEFLKMLLPILVVDHLGDPNELSQKKPFISWSDFCDLIEISSFLKFMQKNQLSFSISLQCGRSLPNETHTRFVIYNKNHSLIWEWMWKLFETNFSFQIVQKIQVVQESGASTQSSPQISPQLLSKPDNTQ